MYAVILVFLYMAGIAHTGNDDDDMMIEQGCAQHYSMIILLYMQYSMSYINAYVDN